MSDLKPIRQRPGWIPDDQREHFVPANRRRGLPNRPKRAFASPEEALAWLAEHPGIGGQRGEMQVYKCSVCGDWHTARAYRDGDPRRKESST